MSTALPDVLLWVLAGAAVVIAIFVEPNNGTLSKWAYWGIAPVLAMAAAGIFMGSVLAGLVSASIIYPGFYFSYLQYKDRG